MTHEQLANAEHYLKLVCDDYEDGDEIRDTVSATFAHIEAQQRTIEQLQKDSRALDSLSVITVEASPLFIGFKRGKFFIDVVNECRFPIAKTEHCILQDAINLAYEHYEKLKTIDRKAV